MTYLWSPNIFPGVSDPACLLSSDLINAFIPSGLDQVLELKDAWCAPRKLVMALSPGALNVRYQHLNVSVPTEATFLGCLANMQGAGMTIVSLLDGPV